MRYRSNIAHKIRRAIQTHGLRQSKSVSPFLQEARTVNQQQGGGFYTSKSGTFFSQKTKKEMEWESKNEEAILKELDIMADVTWFSTQCISFTYTGSENEYEYTPDIVVKMEHDQVVVIEAKPAKTVCDWMNYRKYLAGKQICGKNDWHYLILSAREGTIEDMAGRHVSDVVECDFVKQVNQQPPGKYGGLRIRELIQFKEKYDLIDLDLVTIALRNDLVFYTKPITCTKLPVGYSWSRIMSL